MIDDALEELLAEDPGGPVIVLNPLRDVPDTGRADYLAHIAHTQTISGRYGTEPLFWGDGRTPLVADDEQVWGSGLLVRSPSRPALADLVGRPAPAPLVGGDGRTPLVADDEQVWGSVLLVRYPSRQAFADMMGDPAHLAGAHVRIPALAAAARAAPPPPRPGHTSAPPPLSPRSCSPPTSV